MTKKIALILFCTAFIISCKSKKPTVSEPEKVPVAEITSFQKDRAYSIGKRVLSACNTSKFKAFTKEEATDKVIQNTTLERLSSTCRKFSLKYGKFVDLRLAEAIRMEDNSILFRFKADYEKKFTQKELQVTLNENNQVSAIKSTDWTDTYTP